MRCIIDDDMANYCCPFIRDPGGLSYKGKRSIACYYLHVSVSLRTILISFIDVNTNITNNVKCFFSSANFSTQSEKSSKNLFWVVGWLPVDGANKIVFVELLVQIFNLMDSVP